MKRGVRSEREKIGEGKGEGEGRENARRERIELTFQQVAAIIGKSFSFKLLESIYPIPDAKQELMENLLILRKLNILSFEDVRVNSQSQANKVRRLRGREWRKDERRRELEYTKN
jgi:hypothetical protein